MKTLALILSIHLWTAVTDKQAPQEPKADKEANRLDLMLSRPDDEALHPEIQAFIDDWPEPMWDNNAYVYAWGMGKVTDEPYQVGLTIAKKLAVLNKDFDYLSEYDASFLDAYPDLPLPDNDITCRLDEKGCFDRMLNQPVEVEQAELLIQRHHQFFSYPIYHDTSLWEMSESPLQSFRLLTTAQKLIHQGWIQQYSQSKQWNDLSANIAKENRKLRTKLSQSESLVSKMVFTYMYSAHIELIHGLWVKGWLSKDEVKQTGALKPLSEEALNTYKAFANEERVIFRMLQKSIRPEYEKTILSELLFPGLTEKLVQPNRLMNALYFDVVEPGLSYQKLDAQQFYQKLVSFDLISAFDESTDPALAMFNQSTAELKEKFMAYPARLHELNMKVGLFKDVVKAGGMVQLIDDIESGEYQFTNHYNGGQPVLKDGLLCFDTPFKYKRATCLAQVPGQTSGSDH